MEKVHLIYYSPAFSTRKIMRSIAKGLGLPVKEYDITQGVSDLPSFGPSDLGVFGVPVYAGRVPALAVEYLQKIKGNSTPTILVCIYGNREYDDALLELKDICKTNNFVPFAAGAFIARHSIFPNVAINRPDEQDDHKLIDFAKKCILEYEKIGTDTEDLYVKGNYPYREPSKVPLVPKGDSKCDKCGTCVKMCPTHAIPEKNPKKTDKNLCISCARCIAVCPRHSRKFRGLIYSITRKKFESNYATVRKEPEVFFFK